MENKIKNLIRAMKESQMTVEEKESIRLEAMNFAENNPRTHSWHYFISPYFKPSPYFSKISFTAVVRMAGTLLLILVVGTGGLSYASASALPGDFLYPVKINLKEKIEENLVFVPEQKIALRQKRIETRFKEVETLIKEKRITPESRATAELNIQIEKEKIGNDLEEINKENPEVAETAKMNLESSINTRQEKIDLEIKETSEMEAIERELDSIGIEIEGGYVTDLESIGDIEKENIENSAPEVKEELLIQNIEIVPEITLDNLPISSPEKIETGAPESQEENKTSKE